MLFKVNSCAVIGLEGIVVVVVVDTGRGNDLRRFEIDNLPDATA
jgi:hypothetical protein